MHYTPKVNDYVAWNDHEGWVYFVCPEYISIELSVKEKSEQSYSDCPLHAKTHCLLVCQSWYWDQLVYVKSRKNRNVETLDHMEVFIREFQ